MNFFAPTADHPTDFILRTSRMLAIPDSDLLHMVKEPADEYATLLEDEFDYMNIILSAMISSNEDRATLLQELKELMS